MDCPKNPARFAAAGFITAPARRDTMTGIAGPSFDRDALAQFFRAQAIDEFVVVPASAIAAPPGRRPADLFPRCRTVILFGKVMGDDLFTGSVADTAPRIAALKQELIRVSDELTGTLQASGSAAVSVNSVIVEDGKQIGRAHV